jgi:integrase
MKQIRVYPITDKDLINLFNEIFDARVQAAVFFMWKYGFTLSETLGLRWEDLRIENNGDLIISLKHRDNDYGAKKGFERLISVSEMLDLGILSKADVENTNIMLNLMRDKFYYDPLRIINLNFKTVKDEIARASERAFLPIRLKPYMLRQYFIINIIRHNEIFRTIASTVRIPEQTFEILSSYDADLSKIRSISRIIGLKISTLQNYALAAYRMMDDSIDHNDHNVVIEHDDDNFI